MNEVLLLAVGLKREAALIGGAGVACVVGGGDAQELRARLDNVLRDFPARGVVSVGIGGALAPWLKVGDWVVADQVVSGDRTWSVDRRRWDGLRAALQALTLIASPRGAGPREDKGLRRSQTFIGTIAASDVMVADVAAKAALHAQTGALAVDMESHVAAAFAAEHGLPFAALRVISDGADRALPRAAQAGMKKDGGMDVLAVLRDMLRDPRQLPALIRTGREAEVAFRQVALLGRHDLLGRLGVGDLDLGQLALDVI